MLKQRIITAVILVPLTLLLLFFLPPILFALLTAVVTLWAAWEWTYLMQILKYTHRILYLVIVLIALYSSIFIFVPFVLLGALIWWLLACFLIIFYPSTRRFWGIGVLQRGVMGLFVLVPCWVAINFIRNQQQGIYVLLFLFVLIWGADITAYFIGRAIGKQKLAPHISPGKTIVGVTGAIIFAIFFTIAVAWMWQMPYEAWPFTIILSMVTVLFSVEGDLFESMLKRQANLKDSSQLLPGHGGLLDRIDSLTAASPVFALGAIFLGLYFS